MEELEQHLRGQIEIRPELKELMVQWHNKVTEEGGCVAHDEGQYCCVERLLGLENQS